MRMGKLSAYQQQAYESAKRFDEAKTYPGAIRAATPGDTQYYHARTKTILNNGERHYWRAVVDDPLVEHLVPLRIRLKNNVWVTTGWETRMQVVQVLVPRGSTVAQVIQMAMEENPSPYTGKGVMALAVDGKELSDNATIEECNLDEFSIIDAVDGREDHLAHLDGHRPKDWNVDELTMDDMRVSPYQEMQPTATMSMAPRFESRPMAVAEGYKGLRNYGKVRPES